MAGITGDRDKIKLGPQRVSFGASGAEVVLGFTSGGVELTYDVTYVQIMVDQLGSPVDLRFSGEVLKAKVNLSEISQDNFLIAFPAASAASGAASAVGVNFGRRPGYSVAQNASGVLILHPIGKDDADLSEDWTFPIAVNQGSVTLPYKVDQETIVPLEFLAIADPAREDGQHLARYGY